jgi:transposase InsO family protein
VKDRATGRILLQGLSSHGLYSIPFLPASNKLMSAMVGEKVTVSNWHSRLGHPALRIVRRLLSKFQLPFLRDDNASGCSACLSSKSHKLAFTSTHTRSSVPLALIYTDVWGPSPIYSSAGFRYYVSFLDDFSRYSWIFPISCKSDVCIIFNQFQSYVEKTFSHKIKCVQSDWGGEYRSLSKILQQKGITHRLSCPHTHQQNGAIERKHRHIVETGLALLSHAQMPRKYWDDAFVTACYLINRLPAPALNHKSPLKFFSKLLRITNSKSFWQFLLA